MLKTFTPEDLILFYYKETDAEDTLMIKNSLVEDEELKEEYLEVRQIVGLLNKAERRKPSQTSIDIIMEYSRDHKTVL
ncbi:MAG: hypothetical protein GY751_10020 [Bacteroidetes bacterium]|nr:hypothetical protein [Bacteroidota bacterium]